MFQEGSSNFFYLLGDTHHSPASVKGRLARLCSDTEQVVWPFS